MSVGLDDLGRLYLKEWPISLIMVPISTINTKYVNNIMWEELTKIEICAIIWWIIKILCLWYPSPMEQVGKFEIKRKYVLMNDENNFFGLPLST